MTWLNAICITCNSRNPITTLLLPFKCTLHLFYLWYANVVNNQKSFRCIRALHKKRGHLFTVSCFACFETTTTTKRTHTINYLGLNPCARWHKTHQKCKWSGSLEYSFHVSASKNPTVRLTGVFSNNRSNRIQIHQRCHKFQTIKRRECSRLTL